MVSFSLFLAENLSKILFNSVVGDGICDHKDSVQKFEVLFSNMTESQNVRTIMICLSLELSPWWPQEDRIWKQEINFLLKTKIY